MVAHNGELNSLRGNVNMMRAREGTMRSSLLGDDLWKCFPVIEPDMSDSGALDNALELVSSFLGGFGFACFFFLDWLFCCFVVEVEACLVLFIFCFLFCVRLCI